MRAATRLTVLYDPRCAFCRQIRSWLLEQPKYVPMDLVAAGSAEARRRFPGLSAEATLAEVTVVGDDGKVYLGAKAWLMCLWALKRYRGLAMDLSAPELLPLARRAVAWVSRRRFALGAFVR